MDNTIILQYNLSMLLNFTDVLDEYKNYLYIYDKPLNVILITIYIPLFLLALTSNVLVILVVSRYKSLRSITNYFLVNLSVADLLVTIICMPVAVGQAIHPLWLYGSLLCKLTHYLQGRIAKNTTLFFGIIWNFTLFIYLIAVSVSTSVFTITAMSLDRYFAIRHPMTRKFKLHTTSRVICGIWLLALALFSPLLMVRKQEGFSFNNDAYYYCVEVWPDNASKKTFGLLWFISVYAIPGVIVLVAYCLMGLRLFSRQLIPEYQLNPAHSPSNRNGNAENCRDNRSHSATWQVSAAGGRLVRERRRVAKILLILALVFAFCWLPYSCVSLILDFRHTPSNPAEEQNMESEFITVLLPFTILLGHINSAINPILYSIMSKTFRRSLSEMIRHPTRARERQQFKIRMTFRKKPNLSQERQSSKRVVRNHHAPDPPANQSNGSENRNQEDAGASQTDHTDRVVNVEFVRELCNTNANINVQRLMNKNIHKETGFSSTSSGYGSFQDATVHIHSQPINSYVCAKSGGFPYFGNRLGNKSSASWSVHACGSGEKYLNYDTRKVEVPSTICEESESSQRSLDRKTLQVL